MRRIVAILVLSSWSVSAAPHDDGQPRRSDAVSPIGEDSRQLLLVRTASWNASRGVLQRYERAKISEGARTTPLSREWKPVGEAIAVSVGRNGMAWGRGLHDGSEPGPAKREGDGRSPAGAFALGRAFGVAAALPAGAHGFPYLPTRATTYCVEEARSDRYNEIIDSSELAPRTWERWSELRRSDGLFDWGVVVRQNDRNTRKGAGSCVFLHIWRGPRFPTAGCTAMSRDSVVETVTWLESDAQPLLVQLPEPAFVALRAEWGLPGAG